jgi:hypothetical protein
MIVPSSTISLNISKSEFKKKDPVQNRVQRGDPKRKPQEVGFPQISEQQVKELHLLYESTLNKKKQHMYDYELDNGSREPKISYSASSCLRKFIANACCGCNKIVGLKYVKRYTTR